MITEERLKKIEERVNSATKGPWVFRRWLDDCQIVEAGDNDVTGWRKDHPIAYIAALGGWGYSFDNNREFLANSRQDVPDLIAEIHELREALRFYAEGYHYTTKTTGIELRDTGIVARQALGTE